MTEKYPSPPIREAVCEFRFRSEGSFDIAVPGLVYSKLRGEYPDRLESPVNTRQLGILVSSLQLGHTQDPPDPPEARVEDAMRSGQDLRFWRKDSIDGAIVLGQGRLAISHYAPYRSWEEFQPDIIRALDAYMKEAKPAGIQRIGLRYINDIGFDQASVEPADFFTYYPNLGPDLPSGYTGLNMSVQFPFEEERDRLRLQLLTRPSDEDTRLMARLDLDYSLAKQGTVSFDEMPQWLELAHQNIIDTFEGCLTDKLRTMFREEPS